jgi:hypothetical protein
VVAADPGEAVGDLAAPLRIDDHHEVEHARGERVLVLAVALAQQLAQRRLDGGGRGVALAPDGVGGGQIDLQG